MQATSRTAIVLTEFADTDKDNPQRQMLPFVRRLAVPGGQARGPGRRR